MKINPFKFASCSYGPICIAAIFLMIFIVCYYYLCRKRRDQRKLAPSPPGAWPVIGHLHLLHNAKLPHHTLGAMADKYGPIFRLQLGSRSALVVSNWEMAKESMCINDAAAASRPELSVSKHFSYDFAMFGLASYGPYWREMRKITHLELLSNPRVQEDLQNMIAGGTESTTVTLTWTMALLLNNPHTLEMAQQELDAVVGRDRRVNESDISKLHYLQAVVKEVMRMYHAGPLLGPREFSRDCVVAGYFVPKGTQLIPNIWKIQTDPRVWPNPFEFKPERFLTTHKDVDAKGNHFELISFGSERRGCHGVAFGLQMVHFILAGFLQSFDVKNSSANLIDMSEILE